MGFRLTIGDFLDVSVKGSVRDGARDVPFAFTLQAKRISTDAYRAALGDGSKVTVREFLTENITGWTSQRLVLDDTDQPAAFSADAFAALLSVVGMEQTILAAYLRALQISDTSAGRAKN
jgi:hypothetical protein